MREQPLLSPDDLLAIVVLGYCLDKPVVKGLILPPAERLVDPEHNSAFRIAQAWAKAWDPANDGAPDPDPADSDYRHIVLQAQIHRRNLAVALEAFDLLKYYRYVAHLSDWYLERDAAPRVGRVMRALLSCGLGTLGLVRAGADAARAETTAARRGGRDQQLTKPSHRRGPAMTDQTPSDEHVLNEVDTYGPAYMKIAERLGGYDSTSEDAAALVRFLGWKPGTTVVDAGCGFGRYCAALAEQGMEATGIDISPAAIAEAEKRSPGPRYIVADLTQPLPEGVGPFDVVVNLYSSFGYGATEAEDMDMLRAFRRAGRRAAARSSCSCPTSSARASASEPTRASSCATPTA